MWPVKKAESDENELGVLQTPQRKSSGRSPLEDITTQSGVILEPNILADAHSLSKPSSLTPLLNIKVVHSFEVLLLNKLDIKCSEIKTSVKIGTDLQPKVALSKLKNTCAADGPLCNSDPCTDCLQPSASSLVMISADDGPAEMLEPVVDELALEKCDFECSQLSESLSSCFQLSQSANLSLLKEQEEIGISTLNLYTAFVSESHDPVTLTSQEDYGDSGVASIHGRNETGLAQSTENEKRETLQSSKASASTSLNCAIMNLEVLESVQPPSEFDLSADSCAHISAQIPLPEVNSTSTNSLKIVAESSHVVGETSKVDSSVLHSGELKEEELYFCDVTEELKASFDLFQLASSPDTTKVPEADHFFRMTTKVGGVPTWSIVKSASPLGTTDFECDPSNTDVFEDPSLISETQDAQNFLTARGHLLKPSFVSLNLLQLGEDANLEQSMTGCATAKDESDQHHLLQLEEHDLQTMTLHTQGQSASNLTDLLENEGETGLVVEEEEDIHSDILPSGDECQSLVLSEPEQQDKCFASTDNFPNNIQSRLAHAEAWTMSLPHSEVSIMTPVLSSSAETWMTPIMLLEESMKASAMFESVKCSLSPVSQQDVGTNMTPVTNSCAVTWVTPIALLERSMNTSGDFSMNGKREACAKDKAAETDSLLWNFSRENLNSISRTELESRLEHALIIIEALSRQLQDWQQKQGLAANLRPSEQRETFTQTDVTHATEEEKYHYNLYVRAMEKINSLQNSQQDDERLREELQKASESLESLYTTFLNTFAFAEKMYQLTQKEKKVMRQDVCQMRDLLSNQSVLQHKMNKKLQDSLHQEEEMKSKLEEALRAKEAANGCLEDLSIHSSSVISQLRLHLDSERDLCAALREAYEQQLIYHKECMEFSQNCKSLCSNVEDNQVKMQLQCNEMKNLVTLHRLMMDKMSSRMQAAVEERTIVQLEMEHAVLEREKACSWLHHLYLVMGKTP
ncbi:uncharacterized protein LOC115097586 [Rhinatrema bivittatum]|uniref:uncharacterized protein LOC115097586 n=1 Tax=Rhinatrema bivittatum TaxID=194408 RepID=UPI0011295046|nr:uncharacterized protein LOC115097586 [Rhinatrema bivittatum]